MPACASALMFPRCDTLHTLHTLHATMSTQCTPAWLYLSNTMTAALPEAA